MPGQPKFSIASLSLGSKTYHDLPTKIRVASESGYDGIEIYIPDFESFVEEVKHGHHKSLFNTPLPSHAPELEKECAIAISYLCQSLSIQIPILQPICDFENFQSEDALKQALDAAEHWIQIARYLGTDLVLVCSNLVLGPYPLREASGNTMEGYLDAQVRAFRMLGKRAEKYGIRVGYEPLAWGTVINRWEQVWKVVERVDMPNVGIILDSFNYLGQQFADPSIPGGVRPIPASATSGNCAILARKIPAEKLFFYQLGDASRPCQPFVDLPTHPARMTWSRSSRLFPFEQDRGGFMPVCLLTAAVMKTGYDGWWSLEVFNTSLEEKDVDCPRRHGIRGMQGLNRVWDDMCGCSSPRSRPESSMTHSVRPPLTAALSSYIRSVVVG